jgi:NADPH-dependent ferric siderophore reductase
MLLTHLTVRSVERPSPSFARFELGGPEMADFGVDGPLYDQRIKLLFPGPTGLPELSADNWWADFLALPEETRGAVRTYTIAGVRGEGADTRILVDVVLHQGTHGPGSTWALQAEAGDELLGVLPHRHRPGGGIEFDPGEADRLLIVGDETALPAVTQILRDLPAGRTGSVFLEVPLPDDVCDLPVPEGIEVTWLPRGDRPVGEAVVAAVCDHHGFAPPAPSAEEVDPGLWETPTYAAGRLVTPAAPVDGRYAWIAGEAGLVTTLRRHLVGELGMPRQQVAFMGYWRIGVAMRG